MGEDRLCLWVCCLRSFFLTPPQCSPARHTAPPLLLALCGGIGATPTSATEQEQHGSWRSRVEILGEAGGGKLHRLIVPCLVHAGRS